MGGREGRAYHVRRPLMVRIRRARRREEALYSRCHGVPCPHDECSSALRPHRAILQQMEDGQAVLRAAEWAHTSRIMQRLVLHHCFTPQLLAFHEEPKAIRVCQRAYSDHSVSRLVNKHRRRSEVTTHTSHGGHRVKLVRAPPCRPARADRAEHALEHHDGALPAQIIRRAARDGRFNRPFGVR